MRLHTIAAIWRIFFYADDTLLLASSDGHSQKVLSKHAEAGQLYGMELHGDKFQLLPVQCQPSIHTPSGDRIEPKWGIDYFGSIVSCGGLMGHALRGRIGVAQADFLQLQKV